MIFHNEILTSRQNTTVKWLASLKEKKYRDLHRCFTAEGEKLAIEAAQSQLEITHIVVSESKYDGIEKNIFRHFSSDKYSKTEVIKVTDEVFEKISSEKAPQGIISIIKYLDFFKELDIIYKEDFFLKRGEKAIALYSLRDPGNLGAIIRSAVAFGIEHIVLSADTADVYNTKVARSAMGGLFRVKITVVKDFTSFVNSAVANGRNVYAAELTDTATSVLDICPKATDIFVIGNEGHGIDREISRLCSGSVYIPISNKTESLNASVAASVLMWEQTRA